MEGGGEGSWFGGLWKVEEKVLGLVAYGRWRRRFLVWWPMEGGREGSWFGGLWKEKEKEKGYWLGGQCKEKEKVLGIQSCEFMLYKFTFSTPFK
jgi:hypothetical protein